MGLIGSIVGGALSAGGAIFGGISASKAMKKRKRMLRLNVRKTKIGTTKGTMRTLLNVPMPNAF